MLERNRVTIHLIHLRFHGYVAVVLESLCISIDATDLRASRLVLKPYLDKLNRFEGITHA